MITVTGPLWLWNGENGSWHFITVPEEQSDEIRAHACSRVRGFGSVRVEATIDDVQLAHVGVPDEERRLFPAGEGRGAAQSRNCRGRRGDRRSSSCSERAFELVRASAAAGLLVRGAIGIAFLLVIDLVLLVDALVRFRIADALELGLGRDVFLKVAARSFRLGSARSLRCRSR